MSYEQFRNDLKETAGLLNHHALEELDRAFSTDEQLLDKACEVLYNLERVVSALRNDINNYRNRIILKR